MASIESKKGPITDINESWEGHTHYEIEEYLKNKIVELEGNDTRVKTSLSVVDGTLRSFVSGAEVVTFKYIASCSIGNATMDSCRVRIAMGNTVIEDKVVYTGMEIESANIAEYLNRTAENTYRVSVTVYTYGESGEEVGGTTQTITYQRAVASVVSNMTLGAVVSANSYLRYTVTFSGSSAKLCYRFYQPDGTPYMYSGSDYWSTQLENLSGNYSTTIDSRNHIQVPAGLTAGTHKVEVWIELNDSNNTQSEKAVSTIITTSGSADGALFLAADDASQIKATINDYVAIHYTAAVYRTDGSTGEEIPVVLMEQSGSELVVKAIKNVNSGAVNTWNYLVKNPDVQLIIGIPVTQDGEAVYERTGTPRLTDKVIYLSFSAASSAVTWSADETGLLFYLTAQNKSNNDYDIGTWKDKNYEVEFEDVQWNSSGSGWVQVPLEDESGKMREGVTVGANYTGRASTALRLIGTSRARIKDFYPFYSAHQLGILEKGRTLKMSFMVTNVSDPNARIIDCFDDSSKTGFYVTGDAIYINLGKELVSLPTESQAKAAHNERHFTSGTRFDLTITVQPYYQSGTSGAETKHEIRYYVNGELAGFDVLSTSQLTQRIAKPLTFGGSGAILYLFDVRAYDYALTAFDVMRTRTMDLDSSKEILATFNKNNFYTLLGADDITITLQDALNYGKWMAKNGRKNFAVWATTNLCNGSDYVGNTKTHSTKPESFYLFRFTTDTNGNGIIDPDLTIYIEASGIDAAKAESYLRHRRQGTSTAKEEKGNIRVDVRNTCYVHKWNPLAQKFYEDTIENREAGYVYNVGKKAKIWQIPDADAIPCYLLTCKKNPNESTQARNLPTAKWYEDCCRHIAKQGTAYEECLTMPQQRELESIIQVHEDAGVAITREEAIDKIKTRQCVDGIPSLGFEIPYLEDVFADSPETASSSKLDLLSVNDRISFGGQFDMITDKTNMQVFGFGGYNTWDDVEGHITWNEWGKGSLKEQKDEDFSIEWRRNDSEICNFLTADLSALDGNTSDYVDSGGNTVTANPFVKDLDHRYPEWTDKNGEDQSIVISWSGSEKNVDGYPATRGMEKDGPIQRLFDFVRTCTLGDIKPTGYEYINGAATASYLAHPNLGGNVGQLAILEDSGTVTWMYDNDTARIRKFRTELKNYCAVNQILFNGLAIDAALMVDQDTKNQFFSHFTGENSAAGKALLRLLGYDFDSSWDMDNDNFFRFDRTVEYSDGLYDGGATYTYDNGDTVKRSPAFWELVYAAFPSEIAALKRMLYAGFLNKTAILKYMHDNQVELYNSIHYNVNSEYSYTSKEDDYKKSHGSAKEHTEWFVEGRMYFIAGASFSQADTSSDFGKAEDQTYLNMGELGEDFAAEYPNNYNNRGGLRNGIKNQWPLEVTAYERTYMALGYSSGIAFGPFKVDVSQNYDSNFQPVGDPIRPITVVYAHGTGDTDPLNIVAAGDSRFTIWGGKNIKSIKGLAEYYIVSVAQWGGLTNIEELEIGSTKSWTTDGVVEYYRNPNMRSINFGSYIFGSCKKLNLAGIVNLSNPLSLLPFPILEEFEGTRMNSVPSIDLPVSNSLKVLHYPAESLRSVIIDNKPNLEEIRFDQATALNSTLPQLDEVQVTGSSQTAAVTGIELLLKYFN